MNRLCQLSSPKTAASYPFVSVVARGGSNEQDLVVCCQPLNAVATYFPEYFKLVDLGVLLTCFSTRFRE